MKNGCLTEWGAPLQWLSTNCPEVGQQSIALNKDLGTVQLVPPARVKSRPSQQLMLSYLSMSMHGVKNK